MTTVEIILQFSLRGRRKKGGGGGGGEKRESGQKESESLPSLPNPPPFPLPPYPLPLLAPATQAN